MAIVTDDDLLRGLRGRVGDLVFRRVRGQTIMSRRPRKQDATKQSEARKLTRSKFKEAAAWAVSVRRDPKMREYYHQLAKELQLPNGYIAAVKEYMNRETASSQVNRHPERRVGRCVSREGCRGDAKRAPRTADQGRFTDSNQRDAYTMGRTARNLRVKGRKINRIREVTSAGESAMLNGPCLDHRDPCLQHKTRPAAFSNFKSKRSTKYTQTTQSHLYRLDTRF